MQETVTGKLLEPKFWGFPERPEEDIPSKSLHGNSLWSLLESCWAGEKEEHPSAENVSKAVSLAACLDLSLVELIYLISR